MIKENNTKTILFKNYRYNLKLTKDNYTNNAMFC